MGKTTIQNDGSGTNSPYSIRNYIGKEWFLKMALQTEPTPLARRIADVLRSTEVKCASSSVKENGLRHNL